MKKPRGQVFHYYCCRAAFSRLPNRGCSGRNVRAEKLEGGIWREVRRVLSDPAVVLRELEHQRAAQIDPADVARLEQEVASLVEREKRLVRLYTFGEIDEAFVREEGAGLKRQRAALEGQLAALQRPASAGTGPINPDLLAEACAAVAEWLDRAGDADRAQALEALQIAVRATQTEATVTGVLPCDAPTDRTDAASDGYCHDSNHADARGEVIDRPEA